MGRPWLDDAAEKKDYQYLKHDRHGSLGLGDLTALVEFSVSFPEYDNDGRHQSIRKLHVRRAKAVDMQERYALGEILAKRGAVIHIHEFRSLLSVAAHSASRSLNIPYVLSPHGGLQRLGKEFLKSLFDRIAKKDFQIFEHQAAGC